MHSTTDINISVVSHGQGDLIHQLLFDLEQISSRPSIRILLTKNIAEHLPFQPDKFSFPVHVTENPVPRGFSANHNSAFAWMEKYHPAEFFCVLNPDIRLNQDVFTPLSETLVSSEAAVVAPIVKNGEGHIEDSARPLPTPLSVMGKAMGFVRKARRPSSAVFFPDWIAGMFMLFRSEIFALIGGYDDRFFLYYEDVDICCRLRLAGYKVAVDNSISVVHDARKDSHRRLRYLGWHLASMTRFFCSRIFFRSLWKKLSRREAPWKMHDGN